MLECPQCGAQPRQPGQNNCTGDGQKLIERPIQGKCKGCGFQVDSHHEFCGGCGLPRIKALGSSLAVTDAAA